MSEKRRGLSLPMKRALFGLVMLTIAAVLLAVAWSQLPDGSLEIRLPGRTARGPSLGSVPALDHTFALAYFAAASFLYTALALILRDRFRGHLAALPAVGVLAASSMLAGVVMNYSSSDGYSIAFAILWIPSSSGVVLLFGYAVEGLTESPIPRRMSKRKRVAAPPLPAWRKRLFTVLGLLAVGAAILLLVVSIVAYARGRVMRLPLTGYALPYFEPAAGTTAAVALLAAAAVWLVALRGSTRSFVPLAMVPAAAALSSGFLVLGAMASETGPVEILLGFAVITVIVLAIGALGSTVAASAAGSAGSAAAGTVDPPKRPTPPARR